MIKWLVLGNIALYAVPCLFKAKEAFKDILWNVPHYLFFAPSYVHTFLIFAFVNVDDLSWGTKGLETAASHGQAENIDPKKKAE
jgi:cellulose synthase/poly-beta-1,6-N-acetylglucosamine synthase-like glycosyltransferase